MISGLRNVLRSTNLRVTKPTSQPIINNVDVSKHSIVFVGSDFFRPSGLSSVYSLHINNFDSIKFLKPRKLINQQLVFDGSCSSPWFSPDGSLFGFIKNPYNSPVDTRFYLSSIKSYTAHDSFTKLTGVPWNLSPNGFEFSSRGGRVHLIADNCGWLALY